MQPSASASDISIGFADPVLQEQQEQQRQVNDTPAGILTTRTEVDWVVDVLDTDSGKQ
jgi:hypothetical protein